MNCKQLAALAGCVRHADGTKTPVTIHYEYRNGATGNAQLHATRITDAEGHALALAATDSLTVGNCAIDRTSTFSYARLVGAAGNAPVPFGTVSVTVFNYTSSSLSVSLSGDAQALPPFSAHNFSRDPDTEESFSGPIVAAVLSGSIGVQEEILFNFKAVT